jgi:hypothetical protein
MAQKRGRAPWTSCLLAAWACAGCGEPTPPPANEPVKITPAMENMKAEMLKQFNASKAKGRVRAPNPAKR